MKKFTRARALLLALASCLALAGAQESSPVPLPVTTTTTTTQATSPSVISSLLREQLRRESQVAATTSGSAITTTTTTTTTPETKVPSASRLPASQVVPLQVDTSSTTRQFQYMRPVTTTTTMTTTTTTQAPPPPTCQHNNRTYSLGQRWNDDCLQVCECVAGMQEQSVAISACRPRCPTYKDPPGDNCKLVRNASDECCLEWSCELEAKVAPLRVIMQTSGGGQLNVSTTEIKMPAPQVITTTTTTTTPKPTTTTTTRAKPTTQKLQAPVTTTTTTIAPTTRVKPQVSTSTSSTPASARAPKQVQHSNRPERGPIDDEVTSSTSEPSTTTTTPTDDSLVDPEEHHLCIVSADQGWKVNASWQVEPCNQLCRCVFRDEPRNLATDVSVFLTRNLHANDSMPTEIRCGLPERCAHLSARLVATPQCPEPRLKLPQVQPIVDSCQCPEVTCGPTTPRQQQTITPVTSTTAPPQAGCKSRVGGKLLAPGEIFHDECHSICRCSSDGEIRCEPLRCPSEPPSDHLCREWHTIEANSSDSNRCCPEFACKTPAVIVDSISSTQATQTTTTTTTLPTTTMTTSSSTAQPPTIGAKKLSSCLLLGKWLPHGARVPEEMQPRGNEAMSNNNNNNESSSSLSCDKSCSCSDGRIVCQPICPNLQTLGDLPPEDLECAPELAYQDTSECCPKWACLVLQKFQVNLINATTLEILLTLPPIALGQRGHFELTYTQLPGDHLEALNEEPPFNANWQRRASIKTHDGVFSSRQIKYYWADMKPGHRYWFKVMLRFDNSASPLDTPIESPLQTVTIPALPVPEEPATTTTSTTTTTTSTTTTTTTTTTPTPPIQLLQPNTTSKATPTSHKPATSTTTTTSSPSTTTTTTSMPTAPPMNVINLNGGELVIIKPNVESQSSSTPAQQSPPCQQQNDSTSTTGSSHESNRIDSTSPVAPTATQSHDLVDSNSILLPLSWAEHLHQQVHNAPIQQYAWHLLVAFSIMTVLFTIVSYLYFKKSHVVAPITSPHHQSAYDNPAFAKLVSFYANQPHVLMVDESLKNSDNSAMQNMENSARQKNFELEESSPLNLNGNNRTTATTTNNNNLNLHHHLHTPRIHHQNGRQNLI